MGYGIVPYAFKSSYWSMFGSGDLTNIEQWDMEADDLDASLADGTGDDELLPDARQSLRQMIMGEPLDEHSGYLYGYWLEEFCKCEALLPNGACMPFGKDLPQLVQEGLSRAGVAGVSVLSIMYNDPPIKLPIADWPGIGYTAHSEILSLLEAFKGCNLEAEPDWQVRASMLELRGWLCFCAERKLDLVCFYH